MTGNTMAASTLYILYFIIGAVGEKKQHRTLHYNIAVVTSPENSLPKFVTPEQNTTVTVGHNALLACIIDNLQSYKNEFVPLAFLNGQNTWEERQWNEFVPKIFPFVITVCSPVWHYVTTATVLSSCEEVRFVLPMRGFCTLQIIPPMRRPNLTPASSFAPGNGEYLVFKFFGEIEAVIAWVKVSRSSQTILTTHQYVITNDSRVSLSYNDHRSWYLHIREVKEDDRGWYICQVNTEPITSQSMYLQVLVPPKIIEDMTSNDVVVRELTDVTLHCRAVGYPEPYVMWRRGDGNDFIYNGEKVNVVDGEKLHFRKISRLHMGTYYCVAQNGIPPPANKKISLVVHFPPILHVPNQLVGAALNQQITLHCISEAYPKSINYWTRQNGEMIMPESRYEVIYKHDMYTTNMMVTISAVSSNDFGTYTCVSINPLGNTDGVIKLYEITPPMENEWKSSFLGNETEENNFAMDDEIVQLNSTSTASKCRLDTLAASLVCILGEVYKITRRYLAAARIK